MTAPRRRWSFSLRTLFVVVTGLAITLSWLESQLNWIRERHAVLEKQTHTNWGAWRPRARPNWQLRALREQPVGYILVGVGVDAKKFDRITALFPEATVARVRNLDEQDKN